MKKLIFIAGILASAISMGISVMSEDEGEKAIYECFDNNDKNACQALIDDGPQSVEECTKDTCVVVGAVYEKAGHFREAIQYFEKAIALGNNFAYDLLGYVYVKLKDYFNAKKYYEISCNKGNDNINQATSCYNLGVMYVEGQGVRQDYYRARELYKKACDMKHASACNNLGVIYGKGQGVKQNHSIAKQYYGKACDLGSQIGCDNYKLPNNQGVQ